MKKILSLLVFGLSASMVHAVTIEWKVAEGSIKAPGGSAALQSGLVCLFFVAGDDFGETDALKSQIRTAIESGTFQATSALDHAQINPEGGVLPSRIFESDLSSASGGFFLVIFDSETYETSKNYTISTDYWNTHPSYSDMEWGVGNLANLGSWQSVPEPGSLALFTLGAALLILRRKI